MSLLAKYNTLLTKHTLRTKMITTGIISGFGDLLCQGLEKCNFRILIHKILPKMPRVNPLTGKEAEPSLSWALFMLLSYSMCITATSCLTSCPRSHQWAWLRRFALTSLSSLLHSCLFLPCYQLCGWESFFTSCARP